MDHAAKPIIRLTLGLGLVVLLSTCVTYHQPRYGGNGVYFDQFHPQPQAVVVANSFFYPYWSLDYFYASRFGYATGWGVHHGYGSLHPRFGFWHGHHPWQPAPLIGNAEINPRIRALGERSRFGVDESGGGILRPPIVSRLDQRSGLRGDSSAMRSARIQRSAEEAMRRTPQRSTSSRPSSRQATVRQAPRSRPSSARAPSRSSRPSGGSRARPTRQIDPR